MQVGAPNPIGLTEPATARAALATQGASFAKALDLARAESARPAEATSTGPMELRRAQAFLPLYDPPTFRPLGEADRPLGPGTSGSRGIRLDRPDPDGASPMIPLAPKSFYEKPSAEEVDAKARDAAEQLVSVVLVEPILKRLRESSQAAPPFAPTDGEKQFRSMLDAKLAHRVVSAAEFPLVERLARDLRSHMRTEAQTPHAARG